MAFDDRDRTGSGLQRLSELSGYSVGPDDPDVRGWNVVGSSGEKIGTVDDLLVDTGQMKVAALDVDVKGSDHVRVPVGRVDVDRSRKEVHIAGYAGDAAATAPSYGTGRESGTANRGHRDDDVITRSEEEVQVGKRDVSAGDFVVGKHVEKERVQQPVNLRHEEAYVERRPVTGDRTGQLETHENEIRVPLTREEAVVEKRPVVKEELVVGKRVVEDQETVETDVRREEFDVKEGGTGSRKRRT